MLTFDELTHTYRWKGEVRLSVTQIIEAGLHSFARVPGAALEAAQLRGSNVHLMCQFHDEDRLDLEQFSDEERSYLPAWQKFVRDVQPNWTAIERPFYNERHGYPGTPDREGEATIKGERVLDGLYDIKTSASASPVWGVQTAAYCQGKTSRRRFSVQLRPDGDYRLREWPDPMDWPTFLSMLTFLNFTRKHNL